MQIRSIPNQKIKIVFKSMNEYLQFLQSFKDSFMGMNMYTKEYGERIENAVQGSFDAEDASVEGKPSTVIGNKQMADVFVLMCFAIGTLNREKASVKKLEHDNEILRLTVAKMAVEKEV